MSYVREDRNFSIRRHFSIKTPSVATEGTVTRPLTPSFEVSSFSIETSSGNCTFHTAPSCTEHETTRLPPTSQQVIPTNESKWEINDRYNSTIFYTQLFVKGLSKTTITLYLHETATPTTEFIKERIHQKLGIPGNKFYLSFGGKILYDGPIKNYGVIPNSTLHGNLRFGGCGGNFVDGIHGAAFVLPADQASSDSYTYSSTLPSMTRSAEGRLVHWHFRESITRMHYSRALLRTARLMNLEKPSEEVRDWEHCCGEAFKYDYQLLRHASQCSVRCFRSAFTTTCLRCNPNKACVHDEYLTLANYNF